MPVRVVAIDYNPPGHDIQGEHVLIRNTGAAAANMAGWTLRDIAPQNPHVYPFPSFSLPGNAEARIWTKAGNNSARDLYWGLGAPVWNNTGDTAILRDAADQEVSRLVYVRLPPGGYPLRLAVPAFWTLGAPFQPHWQALKDAGPIVGITVIEGSWPDAAKTNPAFKTQAQAHLDSLWGVVLGYVSTRSGPTFDLEDPQLILEGTNPQGQTKSNSVKAWYDEFGQNIDGIYFDELVIPEKSAAADRTAALDVVAQLKAQRPAAKAMILAGQCPDESVVGPNVDWALLWEDREPQYRQSFTARENGTLKPIPAWWKKPSNRRKIVHVVHDCPEPARQHALGLANERNAGNVFVMDKRGLNARGKDVFYDHLPPYWPIEVREADSYYDFAFDPQRALQAAHRYGVAQGKLHAWPNFEAVWYGNNHVRGTFLLNTGAHAIPRDVAFADLPGSPPIYDVAALWKSAHEYARAQGFETALPTFEPVQTGTGAGVRLILFNKNLAWLTASTTPVSSTYQQPTFAEPGSVIRNVGRWAGANGQTASFPTFVPDNPANHTGRVNHYNCYVLASSVLVTWRDVPTPVYIDQL